MMLRTRQFELYNFGAIAAFGITIVLAVAVSLIMTEPSKSFRWDIAIAAGFAIAALPIAIAVGTRRIQFGLFACGTLLVTWSAVRPIDGAMYADLFLLGFVAITLFGTLTRTRHVQSQFLPLLTGSSIMLLGAAVATVFANDPLVSALATMRLAVATLFLPLCVAIWNPSAAVIRICSWLFVLSATTSAGFGVVHGPENEYSAGRILGLATHVNHMALPIVIATGIVVALFLSGEWKEKLLAIACSAVMAVGLVQAGSRAAILGVSIVLVIISLTTSTRRIVPVLLMCGVGLFAGWNTGLIQFDEQSGISRLLSTLTRTDSAAVAASNLERERFLREAWNRVQEKPGIGVGLTDAGSAHNVYLELLGLAGFLGLFGFIIIVCAAAAPLFLDLNGSFQKVPSSHRELLVGLAAGMLGLYVADIVSNSLWVRYMWVPTALLCAQWSICSEETAAHSEGSVQDRGEK